MNTDVLSREVRVLHLEDNVHDQQLVVELLRMNGLNCRFIVARSRDEFAVALKGGPFDVIISDFTLPSYDGVNALSLARKLHPETPFIFFSGTIGEETAVDTLKNGAVDYVLKQRPHRLVAAVHRALSDMAEKRRRRRAEHALQQMEERFRIVARATNDVIWEWDLSGNRVSVSENFQTAFGHQISETSLAPDCWFDFIHPDDRPRVTSGVSASVASGGRVWWSEHRMRREDGSYAHVLDRASISYDAAGRAVRMVGVMIDISERKHAEDKIREQAELLDKAQDAIIVCSLDRSIEYWNRSAERIYGWTATEVLGKNVRQVLFHDENPPQLREAVQSLSEHGEWLGELSEFAKDDRSVIVQARATLIRDGQGKPKSLLLINTDITERKQLEEQFLRSQRLESLGVLVGGIAHDLNNALVPVLIGTEILAAEPLSKDAASILTTMATSTKRGTDMVKQILAFAHGGESRKVPIPAGQLIKEMGKMITGTFPKNINCRVEVPPGLWPVLGIPTQVHQVLMNLCVNARDAMPDGGTLTIGAENVTLTAAPVPEARPGRYLRLTVADTGIGMSPEQLQKIFRPFYTTKEPGKGTGLGLSTSLTIVKNHGGFITVDSRPGRGTEFKVHLPAVANAAEEAPLPPPALPIGQGECILVVDDEESVLAIMRTTLEHYGYRVLTVNGGLEATSLFTAKRNEIALVITDLAMPFMDGRATILTLRKMAPDLKIIATSGAEQEKDNRLESGFKTSGFLAKPFTTEGLLIAVHEALALKN